jgi:hypothetical protein
VYIHTTPLSLIGACPGETTITSTNPALGFGVFAFTASVSIQNVTVGAVGDGRFALVAAGGAHLNATNVELRSSNLSIDSYDGGEVRVQHGTATGPSLAWRHGRVELSDVAFTAASTSAPPSLAIVQGSTLTADRVVITGARGQGLTVLSSSATLSRVQIAQVGLDPKSPDANENGVALLMITSTVSGSVLSAQDTVYGCFESDRSRVRLSDLDGRRCGENGYWAFRGVVSLARAHITDVHFAVAAQSNAMLTASDLVLERVMEGGVRAYGAQVVAGRVAVDLVDGEAGLASVGGSLSVTDLRAGRGLQADNGGTCSVTRGAFSLGGSGGIWLYGGNASLSDVVFDNVGNFSVNATAGSHLTAQRFRINGAAELMASGNATSLDLEDTTIGPTSTIGVFLTQGAQATLRQVAFDQNLGGAITAMNGASLDLEASTIQHTPPPMTGCLESYAIFVSAAHAVIKDVSLDQITGRGVVADGGAQIELDDVTISNVTAGALRMIRHSTGKVARLELHRPGGRGIHATSLHTQLDASDVLIEGASPYRGSDVGCIDQSLGIGIEAELDANVALSRFLVRTSSRTGVRSAGAGVLMMRNGAIEQSPIAIELTGSPVPIESLLTLVLFRDDGMIYVSD